VLGESKERVNGQQHADATHHDDDLASILFTPRSEAASNTEVPFQTFNAVLVVLATIGVSFSVSTAFQCATAQSLMGSTSDDALAALKTAAVYLNWSTALFAAAGIVGVGMQLLFTSPRFRNVLLGITSGMRQQWSKKHAFLLRRIIYWTILLSSWIDFGLLVLAVVFAAQALKVVSPGPGRFVEWSMVVVAVPGMGLWITALLL